MSERQRKWRAAQYWSRMSEQYWSWETGTPKERADMIRSHIESLISHDMICDLFDLTDEGFRFIQDGLDWSPRFIRSIALEANRLAKPEEPA